MKVQLDETDIINKAIENMMDDGRFDELAEIAGRVICTVSAIEQDPHDYFDSFADDCRGFIGECEKFVNAVLVEVEE